MNIHKKIESHQSVVSAIKANAFLQAQLVEIIDKAVGVFQQGGRLLFCGNGGSAADAQHLAAELSGRFYLDRKALDAEALHVNGSYITAVGNDFDFDTIYERAVEAKGRKGDMLIAMSTSGSSENILRACKMARSIGMIVIGFTGENGQELMDNCSICLAVPSSDTPRIQEMHMLLGHILCEEVESKMFA